MKNIEVILFLSHLLEKRGKVRLQHIKGHAGHEGNEGADFVAQRGTWLPEMPERDWTVPDESEDEVGSASPTRAMVTGMVASAPLVAVSKPPSTSTHSNEPISEQPLTANELEDYANVSLSWARQTAVLDRFLAVSSQRG